MSSDSVCLKESNHLLTLDTTYVAGYKCTSVGLYIFVLFIAIGVQVGRNLIWTKSSQASREALHEPKGPKRSKLITKLLLLSLLSFMLYIVNILLILGANLGILASVLIGNLVGVYISFSRQKQDKARTSIELKTMVEEYEDIFTSKKLTPEQDKQEQEHKKQLEATRDALRRFLQLS
tara:strand:- start:277 stop:810 length:534 start_codon:yes stop_codon:yes gene_type:complete